MQAEGAEEDTCKREEVTGDWRKLRNEELYDLICSLNIIWVIKSRIMKWVAYVCGTHKGEEKCIQFC
jgi:hypothetical protein